MHALGVQPILFYDNMLYLSFCMPLDVLYDSVYVVLIPLPCWLDIYSDRNLDARLSI